MPFAKPFTPIGVDKRCQFANETVKRMIFDATTAGLETQVSSEIVGGGVSVNAQQASMMIDYLALENQLEAQDTQVTELLARLNRLGVLI